MVCPTLNRLKRHRLPYFETHKGWTTKTVAVIKESEKRALDTNAVYTQKIKSSKTQFF